MSSVVGCLSSFFLAAMPVQAELPESSESKVSLCVPALYRFVDGSYVDISESGEDQLRWRASDGTSGLLSRETTGNWSSTLGWTGEPDGKQVDLSNCQHHRITFAGKQAQEVDFDVQEVSFTSGAETLAGRLVLPRVNKPVPIVVLVHGSENTSALRYYALQRLLPANGIGVFVYDKRGTGSSQGIYTHDLQLLAGDAVEAMKTAQQLAGPRSKRIGYYGMSQGGWVAPLAATLSPVDFVMLGYGLAISPIEEDREALALDMTRHGFGQDEIKKALTIGAAVEQIIRNNFKAGFEELQAVVARFEKEEWFQYVRGNITGIIISTPEAVLREQGPILLAGVNLDYNPMPVLRQLKTPQLWVLGAEDIDAPYANTLELLLGLKQDGKPISVVVYPNVEHGLYEFKVKNEQRLSTRQPESLLPLLTRFSLGKRTRKHMGDGVKVY